MGNELSPYQRCLLLEGTLLADAPQRAVSGLSPRAAIGPRGSQASRSSPTHGIFGVLPTAQSRSEPRRHFAEQDINFAVVAARMRRWAVLTVLMKAAPAGGMQRALDGGLQLACQQPSSCASRCLLWTL